MSVEPRAFLRDAMIALEEVLQRNDHKPDWMEQTVDELLLKTVEEFGEVITANKGYDRQSKQDEALDLAVCGLMLWAKSGGTLYALNRGRDPVFKNEGSGGEPEPSPIQ